MALTSSEIEDYIDALKRARFQGVRVVQKGDEMVRYGSDAEMAAALAAAEADLSSVASTTPASYSSITHFKRA